MKLKRFVALSLFGLASATTTTMYAAETNEGATSAPGITLSMPNAVKTVERWDTSYYAKAWQAAPTAQSEALIALGLQQPLAMIGMSNLREALAALQGFEIGLLPGPREPIPTFQLRGEQLLAPIQALMGPMAEQAEVDGGTMRLNPMGPAIKLPIAADSQDLVLIWTAEALLSFVPERELDAALRAVVAQFIPDGEFGLTLTPNGLRTRLSLTDSANIFGTIKPDNLAWLPASSAIVMAVDMDLKSYWEQRGEALIALVQDDPNAPDSPQAAMAIADQALASQGIPFTADDILTASQGTITVSVSGSGAILPGFQIGLERSPSRDKLLEWALQKGGHGSINDNELNLLTLRGLDKDLPIVPTNVGLVRTETQWIVSTDSVLLGDMLAGKEGKWVDSSEAKALLAQIDENTIGIGWGNTRAGLRMFTPFLPAVAIGMGQEMPPLAMIGEDLQWLGHHLASNASSDHMTMKRQGNDLIVEGDGPLGGLAAGGGPSISTTAILAGLLLPAITSAREKAQRLESMNNMKQIAMAEFMYQEENGEPSPDFQTLWENQELPIKMFRSPFDRERGDSYTLLPFKGFAAARYPIMVEDPINHNYEGTIVVFGDYSARFVEGEAGMYYYEFVKELSEKAKAEKRSITSDDMKALKSETEIDRMEW